MAPRIFFWLLYLYSNLFLIHKTIETYALAFLSHNNSSVARVSDYIISLKNYPLPILGTRDSNKLKLNFWKSYAFLQIQKWSHN